MQFRCPSCGVPIDRLPSPPLTADAIIELPGDRVVLIRRRFEPLGWALPGGFVEWGESAEEACRREVMEETGLTVDSLVQMHTYSEPDRDRRHPTATVVFVARASGDLRAGDDAGDAAGFPLDRLPDPLCFDHGQILDDYRRGRWGVGPGGYPA